MNQPKQNPEIIDLRARRDDARATARAAEAAKRYVLRHSGLGFGSPEQASARQALAHHFGYRQPRV
jgi:hypothetical protein